MVEKNNSSTSNGRGSFINSIWLNFFVDLTHPDCSQMSGASPLPIRRREIYDRFRDKAIKVKAAPASPLGKRERGFGRPARYERLEFSSLPGGVGCLNLPLPGHFSASSLLKISGRSADKSADCVARIFARRATQLTERRLRDERGVAAQRS